MKRLEVVMINQTYQPSSSLEAVYKGGFSGIGDSLAGIFTMRGASALCFMLLMVLMMVGNNLCKDILVKPEDSPAVLPDADEVPEGVHPYEYVEGETPDSSPKQDNQMAEKQAAALDPANMSWRELYCYN